MQVILAEEQTLEIQHIIGELIKSEVKNARESVGETAFRIIKKS